MAAHADSRFSSAHTQPEAPEDSRGNSLMLQRGFVDAMPCISIVIPTYNSARTLPLCLESIAAQDYPKEKIEIIIADGGSTDSTLVIAQKYTDKIYPNPLKTGEADKAAGVKHARNEIIALIDSDNILPSREWLVSAGDKNKNH